MAAGARTGESNGPRAPLAFPRSTCCVCDAVTTKKCARCKSVFYCSRECQLEQWQRHRLLCAPCAKGFEVFPADQAAAAFIAAYRFRCEDEHVAVGDLRGPYDPERTRRSAVVDFLLWCKCAVRAAVLPSWWDWSAALAHGATHLRFAIEKSDVQEEFGPWGPMTLRVIAERIYGSSATASKTPDHVAEWLVFFLQTPGRQVRRCRELYEDVGGHELWERFWKALLL